MLVADSPLIESPENSETFIESPNSVFLSLDDDEENKGFDELEDLDKEDDDFEDEDSEAEEEEDDDEFDEEEEEEKEDEDEDEDFEDDDF
ncbi:MAG: hypothetical protein QM501_11890 [Gimesia sp.]